MPTLRPFESTLFFPDESPPPMVPLIPIRPRDGEYVAVLDPPREKSRGGVLLMQRGDGWFDPNVTGLDAAERAFDEAYRAWKDAKFQLDRDPKSLRLRMRADALCDVAMAAHERLALTEERRDPGAGYDLRPDAATVIASSADGVEIGDRVMIAPYSWWRFQELLGVPDVIVIGADDPWEDVTPFIRQAGTEHWRLTSNWVAIQMDVKAVSIETLMRAFHNRGTVVDVGPDGGIRKGQKVVTGGDRTEKRPDDSKWFVTKFGPYDGMGVVLVREVDADGNRRVLGTIEKVWSERLGA